MNAAVRRILVAIEHTDRMPVSLIHKAAFLAQSSDARVELLHVIRGIGSQPPAGRLSKAELAEWKKEVTSLRLHRLQHFARNPALQGISVKCTVTWEASAHQAIVRHAVAMHADLVIIGTHRHTVTARLTAPSVDWDLIRHCPAPVLVVKSGRSYRHAAVVAAVDPFHENDKPASLDVRLVQAGRGLARLLDGDLHVFHAFMPTIPVQTLPVTTGVPFITVPPELERMHEDQAVEAVNRLAAPARIPKARRHVELGHVAPELATLLKRLHAGVVIIGAISRSGLQRFLIGNTAERVLDEMPCDVLVIKPPQFKSKSAVTAHSVRERSLARNSTAYAT